MTFKQQYVGVEHNHPWFGVPAIMLPDGVISAGTTPPKAGLPQDLWWIKIRKSSFSSVLQEAQLMQLETQIGVTP